MNRCPCCGQQLQPHQKSDAERLAETLADLKRWCNERGHWIGPGDVVNESTAAAALERSPSTLRDWRTDHKGELPYRKTRAGVRYQLTDLAALLAAETRGDARNRDGRT